MNTPDSDCRVCDLCGAPLGRYLEDGLCSRCLARFTLLEAEEGPQSAPDPAHEDQVSDKAYGPFHNARFGDYELLEEIARGGMGVVYRARQISLNRIVAIKTLLFGQLAGKAAFDRFRAEAETVAHLQHPNIVGIHEIGEADGQPYFSMDYVAGRSLADIVKHHPLPARLAAVYVRKIAQAVHYAHTQGVLHRDLKPANVLIDEADEPRITDFGIARRLTGDSELTLTGQVVGSPNFMPPEQGSGSKAKLGPTADVYGLGALLYYLLTARPPFVAETFEATLTQVLNIEPVAPRQLNPGLPLDLETICLKCLEKDPARRYTSAGELADELERFLKGEPTRARPIGAFGKTGRWCRRKPALAAMAAGLVIAIAIGVGGIFIQWRRAEEIAGRERALAEVRLRERYASDMAVVQSRMHEGNFNMARQVLTEYLPKSGQPDLRGFEWYLYYRLTRGDHLREIVNSGGINSMASTRDGSLLAAGRWAGGVILVDPVNSTLKQRLPTAGAQVCSVAFSPDERLLAVGSDQKIWPSGTPDGVVEIWDLETYQVVAQLKARAPRIAFSPVDKLLAVGSGGELVGRNSGEVLLWRYDQPDLELERLPDSGGRPLFSPDGKLLVTGLRDLQLMVWDVATRHQIARAPAGASLITMKFSPAGDIFATGNDDGTIRLWDTTTHRVVGILAGHTKRVTGIEFLNGGKLLASSSNDQTVRVWDLQKQEVLARHQGASAFEAMTVCAPGKTLVTPTTSGSLQFWPVDSTSDRNVLLDTIRVRFSPDGTRMLSQSKDRQIRLHETITRQVITTISNPVSPIALDLTPGGERRSLLLDFAGDGTVFVTADIQGDPAGLNKLRFWSAASCAVEKEVPLEERKGFLGSALLSPNGHVLAAGSQSGQVAIWSTETGRLVNVFSDQSRQTLSLAFSPDGRVFASNSDDGSAVLREVESWKIIRQFKVNTGLTAGAFSPDGKIYAATCWDWQTYLWRVHDGALITKLAGHNMSSRSVAVSPDMKTLVTGSDDFTIRFWNLATGREMGALHNDAYVLGMKFSPSGEVLACAITGMDSAWFRLWDISGATNAPPTSRLLSNFGTRICDWWLAGPYTKPNAPTNDLLHIQFEPEKAEAQVPWHNISVPDGIVDFGKYFTGNFRVAYLRTHLWVSSNQPALLFLGSDDSVRVWLNGAVVYQTNFSRGYKDAQDKVTVNLREGLNELQLKVVNYERNWKAGVQLATAKGHPLKDFQVLTNAVGTNPASGRPYPQLP